MRAYGRHAFLRARRRTIKPASRYVRRIPITQVDGLLSWHGVTGKPDMVDPGALGTLAFITPTGTPDGTKFLRDDYSWQSTGSGAGGPDLLLMGG